MESRRFQVIVIGGGHAGVEAAWAAANLLAEGTKGRGDEGTDAGREGSATGAAEGSATKIRPGGAGYPQRAVVALVTSDPTKIGVMSCNPAIGGLAKGQLVREIDAMGGLMGLAADATGIQFKVLNTSRGPAVHGPRAQCDKHAYAAAVQRMIASRPEIEVIAGTVERLVVEAGRVRGVVVKVQSSKSQVPNEDRSMFEISAPAVVLTTGTFMRGLMHTGERRTAGGRFGEAGAEGISGALKELGFELGRLKTGTPPRLKRGTIEWESLRPALGDARPVPFSDLTVSRGVDAPVDDPSRSSPGDDTPACFPILPQVECRETTTNRAVHDLIRANLHRAPMYSGQIESVGPRYCPSIEDKVVRFAERDSHTVFLEPESLSDDWVYCNGISTSLPAEVQDEIVRAMPGCARAEVLRYGYAVEYDMVRPHQIMATGMTKRVEGLFLAGQINGTSGYEEAAAQGLVAGINAARLAMGLGEFVLRRDQAYIGVLMDDLVTKTPVEPYRMFTSRAEHRLLLRADNAADRLTPVAEEIGLLGGEGLGRMRREAHARRRDGLSRLASAIGRTRVDGLPLAAAARRPEFVMGDFRRALAGVDGISDAIWATALADCKYEAYIVRQRAEVRRAIEMETKRLPAAVDYAAIDGLRPEARQALARYRPATYGQAGRLEGVTPADVMLLSVVLTRTPR